MTDGEVKGKLNEIALKVLMEAEKVGDLPPGWSFTGWFSQCKQDDIKNWGAQLLYRLSIECDSGAEPMAWYAHMAVNTHQDAWAWERDAEAEVKRIVEVRVAHGKKMPGLEHLKGVKAITWIPFLEGVNRPFSETPNWEPA